MKLESFHWRGKTRQGVSKWEGSQSGPPRVLGKIFTGYGIGAGSVGAALALFSLVTGSLPSRLSPLIFVGLMHGLIFTSIGRWILSMRRTIQHLKPVEEVSQQLGMDAPTIERLAQEKGIKPRLNLNGRDYYEISDFNEANLLLRGSSAPAATPETLLRAASADAEAASDHLLRASAAEPADTSTQTSIASVAQEQPQTLQLRQ